MRPVRFSVQKWTMLLATTSLSFPVCADQNQLPNSGTIHGHSGWASIGEAKEVGKNHVVWLGTFYGTSLNDAGSGFVQSSMDCHGASDIMNGAIVHEGFCTTTDADGDQFYGQNKGRGPLGEPFVGEVTLTGGTGKYAGIKGTNSYKCNAMGPHGQLFCTNEVSYTLH